MRIQKVGGRCANASERDALSAAPAISHAQCRAGLFEAHRARLRRDRMAANLLLLALFLFFLGWSIYISRFYPDRLAEGLPRIFEYFASLMPDLERANLFEGRGEDGRAVPGSITYWYSDFTKYIILIGETILIAITATILGTAVAVVLSFTAARNFAPAPWIGIASRRFLEFCRGVPEILFALVLVFWVGIGPLAGVLAIFVSDMGNLAKLYSEAIENVERKQVEGARATGADNARVIRYGYLPQILPVFISLSLYSFESSTRTATILGLVGAGGIGMIIIERLRAGLFDQVAFVVLNVLVVIAIIDWGSGRIRQRYIGERTH